MRTEQVLDGRYRLDARLGAGGMSVVWRAHDLVLDREVAVKVLAGTAAASPAARERVRSEAQAAARLWHPHVTNVYDYGESPGEDGAPVPYVVMELLPGRTLSERLAEGPLSAPSALRTLAEVAAALAAAHAQDVVHRDVKPSNVMLTPTGAKVVDFGIAAVVGSAELDGDGLLLGTPAYLAPERLTAGQVSAASDVYALGLLIHRVLTNRLPWLAETTTAMLKAHVYAEPAPLPPVEGVPAEVNELCDRCLAKEPSDRPTAAQAAAILAEAAGIVPPPSDDGPPAGWAAAADGRTTSTVPPADNRVTVDTARRRRRRNLLAAGAAVLVAAIAVVALATAIDEPSGGAASPDPGSSGGTGSPGASPGAGSPGASVSGRPGAGTAPTPSAGGGAVPLSPGDVTGGRRRADGRCHARPATRGHRHDDAAGPAAGWARRADRDARRCGDRAVPRRTGRGGRPAARAGLRDEGLRPGPRSGGEGRADLAAQRDGAQGPLRRRPTPAGDQEQRAMIRTRRPAGTGR